MPFSDKGQNLSKIEVVTRLDKIAGLIALVEAYDESLRDHGGLMLVKEHLLDLAQDIDQAGAGQPTGTIH